MKSCALSPVTWYNFTVILYPDDAPLFVVVVVHTPKSLKSNWSHHFIIDFGLN
jgi:hypothetical protein